MTTDAVHDAHPGARRRATLVDGNALAGLLSSVFTGDATLLVVTCGHCGRSGPLAEAAVERDEACAIVRCRACSRTLMTVAETADGAVDVRLEAIAAIRAGARR